MRLSKNRADSRGSVNSRQLGRALPWMLRSRRGEVVSFIEQNNLYVDAQSYILPLLQSEHDSTISDSQAIAMLVAHTEAIPVGFDVARAE